MAGNNKVSNGNMVTNHDSIAPRKDPRTHNSAAKNVSGLHNQSKRRTTQTSFDTLHVDVDLANRRFSTVSPGRRCLSDSKLTVGKRQKNIPASSIHKRKIEFQASPKSERVSPAKRRRSDGGGSSSNGSLMLQIPQRNCSSKHMDYNQNIKDVSECTSERTSSCMCHPGEVYKSMHSIGHRKASVQIPTLSEAILTSPRKLAAPQVNSTTTTLMSHKLELSNNDASRIVSDAAKKITSTCPGTLPYFPCLESDKQKVTTPSTPDSLSEDISDRFLKVDNDILFKKESAIDIVVTDCDRGDHQTRTQDQDFVAESALSDPLPARVEEIISSHPDAQPNKQVTSDRCEDESSVFTEDSSTTDDSVTKEAAITKKRYNKKNWHMQPRAPRKRRIASLTAETKVHLLYEKDEVEAPRKPSGVKHETAKKDATNAGVTSHGMSVPVTLLPPTPRQYAELTPYTLCKHRVTSQTGTAVPCAECIQLYYSISLKEQDKPLNLVLSETCNCTATQCSQSENRCQSCIAPARTSDFNDVGKPTVASNGRTVVEPKTNSSMQRALSAPVISPSKRPTLVPTSMRRVTVDTAECQKLKSFLKSPLMLRVSRHSTDGVESDANMPALVDQLELLQSGNCFHCILSIVVKVSDEHCSILAYSAIL